MILVNAVPGLFQLVFSLIFTVITLYFCFPFIGRITRDIDVEKELAKGNIAVGIIVAAVFIAITIVVQSGISGLSVGLNKALIAGIFSDESLLFVGFAFIRMVLCLVLAVAAIYLALTVLKQLTKDIDEFEELKKGNITVALMMAGVIMAVALIIQSGVIGITAVLV